MSASLFLGPTARDAVARYMREGADSKLARHKPYVYVNVKYLARLTNRGVADSLDVEAVRVEHEGGVVGRTIALADAGQTVVPTADGEGGGMEGVDLDAGFGPEGDVVAFARPVLVGDDKLGLRDSKHHDGRLALPLLGEFPVAQRCESRGVEDPGPGDVGDVAGEVVDLEGGFLPGSRKERRTCEIAPLCRAPDVRRRQIPRMTLS